MHSGDTTLKGRSAGSQPGSGATPLSKWLPKGDSGLTAYVHLFSLAHFVPTAGPC